MARNLIMVEDTRFKYTTNFSGDPGRDRFKNDARRCNIVIDPDMAEDLENLGVTVYETKPHEGEEEGFIPQHYVSVKLNYDGFTPPEVYLISGDAQPILIDEERLNTIDNLADDGAIESVDAILNPYTNKTTGRVSLYVRKLYITQDLSRDPFAAKYFNR